MIAIIDNYDSFTYNLVQRLGEIDASIQLKVVRNDELTVRELAELQPDRLIVSPGPCTPTEAGVSIEAIRYFAERIPVLGVCLGHQSIGQAYGGVIVRAKQLMHGKTDSIFHEGGRLLAGLPNPFIATRYHSLVIDPPTLNSSFNVTAWANGPGGDREIMAIEHVTLPLFGVQFHPESFLTEHGTQILKNFLSI